VGTQRGTVIVRWDDLQITGRHRPEALVLVEGTASEKEENRR
jgi:hypothetical protein